MKVTRVIQELLHAFARHAELAPLSEHRMYKVLNLREDDTLWEEWKGKPGIYYFVKVTDKRADFQYVGRALPGTLLGSRVYDNLKETGKEWDEVINGPDVHVGIIPFDEELWHLLPSLEIYLIDLLEPHFNKRMG